MHKREESVGHRTRFVEIYERNPSVSNLCFPIKLTRVGIRHLTRLVGFDLAIKYMSLLIRMLPKNESSATLCYTMYLLKTNKFNIEYLSRLTSGDLLKATEKKVEWARYTVAQSKDLKSRRAAKSYLSLLQKTNLPLEGKFVSVPVMASRNVEKKPKMKFYIYGPNSVEPPAERYSDYILVFLKPMDVDVTNFSKVILFTNGIYYRSVVAGSKSVRESLIEKYSQIIVSCQTSEILPPFVRAKFPTGDHIAAPMALGRLLYNLIFNHGSFRCIIEGFDFYLSEEMYGKYYPSLARLPDNTINEQLICSGLAAHDALYNFLYVRALVSGLELEGSESFKKIVGMDARSYLRKLGRSRNFSTLRQQ